MNYWILSILFALTSRCVNCKSPALKSMIPQDGRETEVRILRGFQCSTEEYPYLMLIIAKPPGRKQWERLCGGSLLTGLWVLTAAHCIKTHVINYAVLAGTNTPEDGPSLVLVSEVVVHPSFNEEDFVNDIALLRLEKNQTPTSHINFVELPKSALSTEPPCVNALIMGWGLTETTTPTLTNLQCAFVPMLSFNRCHNMYRSYHGLEVYHSQFCTLSPQGIDACQGDSGGPLLCGNTQVGIVSWGIGCGVSYNPGVYTRTDVFLPFIAQYVEGYGNNGNDRIINLYVIIVELIAFMAI